ncbi:major Facilitator Superfamily protein [Janthinobacterium agaricidamnosum NBRC 102515 = DSM 9628]|uniref:Major Facilitator Superfamily protein n=2 Tax=Janthinobacterium agaricidamnosum TaxID=55508 RepID=W0V2E2_9BURK|nr:major Facilitator Superfamily protein [Janthinobacterium agaricidamnosum NBRC 102515 = DSM 9628]
MWGSFGLILPVLTLLLVHAGFSLFEIGLFAALFSLSTVMLELPFGALADRLGRLRAYRWSLLTNGAGCGIMLLCDQKPLLFLAAACFGMARAMNSGTVDAWYVQLLRDSGISERIPYHLGFAELSAALGMALFSLIGGFLPDLLGRHLFANPYKAGFGLSGLLFLLLLWLTPRLFPESERIGGGPASVKLTGHLRQLILFAWGELNIRQLLLRFMLLGGVISILESYWPVVLKNILPATGSTWVFGLFLTLMLVVKGVGGWLSFIVLRIFSARPAAAVAFSLSGLAGGLFMTARVHEAAHLGIFLVLTALFLGIAGGVINALLHQHAPDHFRSTALSFFSVAFQLGSVLSSLLLGYLIGIAGVQAVWAGVSVLVALTALYGLWPVRVAAACGNPAKR